MARTYQGILEGRGKRFALVVSRFNENVTRNLLQGARDCLLRHGVADDDLCEVWVPGAFEIPLVARKLAATGHHDGIVCLGCLIRGATPHFEYISAQCARGVLDASIQTGVPVSFGVLTCDHLDQAMERSGSKAGNKGAEAAAAVLETVCLLRALDQD